MNATQVTILAGAIIVAGGLMVAVKMNAPASSTEARGAVGVLPVTTQETNPYTNIASIPATVDPSSIRFEKLKLVDLASKIQTTTDPADCKQRQFREPDGSGCETVKVLEKVKAIAVDYSYVGPQSSTGEGEIGPTRSSFTVYFRPEELGMSAAPSKMNREQANSLFEVSTSRPVVQEKVIDQQNSHFCEGNYVDGNWVQKDAGCQQQVQYKTQAMPSQYWAVQVSPKHLTVASAGTH
jgi:hypothetical protein